jgi:hypothetical protein
MDDLERTSAMRTTISLVFTEGLQRSPTAYTQLTRGASSTELSNAALVTRIEKVSFPISEFPRLRLRNEEAICRRSFRSDDLSGSDRANRSIWRRN